MKIFVPLFVTFVITSLISCTKSNYQYTASAADQSANTFLFVTYRIHVDSAGKNKVGALDLKQIDGTLKQTNPEHNPDTYILVQQLTKSGKVVGEVKDAHPLYKRAEFVDQHNTFISKEIALKESEFFVRMPLHTDAYLLRVYEVLNKDKGLLNEKVIPTLK